MSSPDPKAHDRSDSDYGMKPNKPKAKALKSRMKAKSSKFDSMIHPEKSHPDSPLGKLHRLMKE